MNSALDYILIILVIFAVAGILSLCVVRAIDKRISDVSINIPKINVPKPEIIINISADDLNKSKNSYTCNADVNKSNKNKEHFQSDIDNTKKRIKKIKKRKIKINNSYKGSRGSIKIPNVEKEQWLPYNYGNYSAIK